MTLRQIDTLILDLDNTIYDWFEIWYTTFYPIYAGILDKSTYSKDEVEKDIRRVHKLHRTAEYSFLVEELQILDEKYKNIDRTELFNDEINEAHIAREKVLKLYPSVFPSLWNIKNKGTQIIAYTESMAFYSAYRLKRVGLDGVIDVLYSPEDHATPAHTDVEMLRSLPEEFYNLQVTETRHTPKGELKPNSKILLDIIRDCGADIKKCAYIGDSLFKDVAMARDSFVLDIHAKYGVVQDKPEYDLLRKVSHWTDEDVERERKIIEDGHDFQPTVVLKDQFSEIFMYCDFVQFSKEKEILPVSDYTPVLETWKKSVEVQQHFNDLGMRTRNYAITVVAAIFAAIGYIYSEGIETTLFGYTFSTGVILLIAALLVGLAFYIMDRFWYHILLKGAVTHAISIEKEYQHIIPGISLGTTIQSESKNVKIFGFNADSTARIKWFYGIGAVMIVITMLGLIFSTSTPQVDGAIIEIQTQSD